MALLNWLSRRASAILALALFIGIALPDLAHWARPLLAPTVVVLLAATLLRIDPKEVWSHLRRPGVALAILAWLLVGAPVLMSLVVRWLQVPDGLGHAMILMASSPALISVSAFAIMMGLDGSLALVLVLATAVLQPFVQPPLALALLGVDLQIGVGALMIRLAILVGGAFLLAIVIRAVAGPRRIARSQETINGVAVLALVLFGIGVMDGVATTLADRPTSVLVFLVGAFAASFGLQAVAVLLFALAARAGLLGPRQALTAALASGNRNLANLIAALGPTAGPDLSLYLAVGQFPLYLVPALLGPIYRNGLRGLQRFCPGGLRRN